MGSLGTYYWATAAGAFMVPGTFDLAGLPPVPPGNEFAIGVTSALTTATWDLVVYWEEVPYLTTV